jgi:class 3 adenylate cyclase
VIVEEPARGQVPPAWFWALPGIERIRALSLGQLPSPPLTRLLGIRPAHVGPGSGTWIMPATGWLGLASGELEISILVEAAVTGVATTTLAPGMDVQLTTLALNYFRPARVQPGNLLVRARVANASRFFIAVEVEIEDPQGRRIAQGYSQCELRAVEPAPPPPPAELRPVEEAVYATPDPYLRAVKGEVAPPDGQDNRALLEAYLEGRLSPPSAELIGVHVESRTEETVTLSMPASEWLCWFSRSIAPGAIAALANAATLTAGWRLLKPGQSFVGLTHSNYLFRALPADGRPVRAQVTGRLRDRNLVTADVLLHDADGTLAGTAHGAGQVVDASRRQRRKSVESKRILATLLFTDIVGSTQRAAQLGDARWQALLAEHRAVVRAHILRCDGVEIDTAGDGFFVRFDSPARALECARAVRDRVKRLGVDVRVGVHAGECELQGRALTGLAVHIGARIQAQAAPGEILVSSTVKDLAMGSGLRFQDRGLHALKGVPGEWPLFALGAD